MKGNLYSQVYATDYQYSRTYPMKKKSDVHETLEDFFRDVGVPSLLVSDEQHSSLMASLIRSAERLSACSIMLRRTL